jgi:nucleoside-diphosphate-sugar epimerase
MLLRDHAAMSSAKARRTAGFTTRIPLAEGLRDTIPWVLQRTAS